MNRPGSHRLGAGLILRDHRLQHREGEAGLGVGLQLLLSKRELAAPFSDGMRDRHPGIAGGEVDPVVLPDDLGKIRRKLLGEPGEVSGEIGAHLGRRPGLGLDRIREGWDPRDHRRHRQR
jgi:hypothetical protein